MLIRLLRFSAPFSLRRTVHPFQLPLDAIMRRQPEQFLAGYDGLNFMQAVWSIVQTTEKCSEVTTAAGG